MADDFLGKFMGSAVRAKVLRVFIFNQPAVMTLAQAVKRSGAPPKTVAKEIKTLEGWGILKRGKLTIQLSGQNGTVRSIGGRQKESAWTVNPSFKFLSAVSKFVHEVSPVHYKTVVATLRKAGRVSAVVLSGCFMGDMTRPADLLLAGDSLSESRLETAVKALERQFGREIRYASFTTPEMRYRLTTQDRLMRETLDYPHLVLLDKTKLL